MVAKSIARCANAQNFLEQDFKRQVEYFAPKLLLEYLLLNLMQARLSFRLR
jgi:hypothetical protein